MGLGPEINTQYEEYEPSLSGDQLTLLFHSDRPGGQGKHDIWVSQRAAVEQPWQQPRNLGPPVNTTGSETAPFLSQDGLTLLFARDADKRIDLWMATRPSTSSAWGPPERLPEPVNSQKYIETEPCLSTDGLTLMFTSTRTAHGCQFELWMCTRPTLDSPFSEPVSLGPELNVGEWQGAPHLTSDGLGLLYHIGIPKMSPRIRVAVRASPTDAWQATPMILRRSATSPCLAADGRTLYFRHLVKAEDGTKQYDLFMSRLVPKTAPSESAATAASRELRRE